MTDNDRDHLTLARKIVEQPVLPDGELDAAGRKGSMGSLHLFGDGEMSQLEAVRDLVCAYVTATHIESPLNVALFGAPGSGKSFTVKQLLGAANAKLQAEHEVAEVAKGETKPTQGPRVASEPVVLNLTQMPSTGALAAALGAIASGFAKEPVPVVFFDEFDTPRGGAPLGWLQWFLAPMNDGCFHREGAKIDLQRVVYVFAGGTAATFEAFAAQEGTSVRSAK